LFVRFVRLLLLVVALSALAAVFVPEAHALRFADTPCIESGPSRMRVCPDAVVGQSYSVGLTGEGGCGPALPYQYRLLNGVPPPGISLSTDGRLTGTPTAAGIWDFWLELSDQDPPSASWCLPSRSEREFRIRVGAPVATVGMPYSFAVGAPGVGVQTWSLASGTLPPGLQLDPSGVVAGIPTSAGAFPLAFTSLDEAGHAARVELVVAVYSRLAITTRRLPSVRSGRTFRARLSAQGAVGAVTYRVVSGRLPVGVRLDGRAGLIRGTPRKAGVYRLGIQALDSLGRTATASIVLTVRKVTVDEVGSAHMRV
jgi:hypothetical protein